VLIRIVIFSWVTTGYLHILQHGAGQFGQFSWPGMYIPPPWTKSSSPDQKREDQNSISVSKFLSLPKFSNKRKENNEASMTHEKDTRLWLYFNLQ
jgi:hypothetical protein